MYAQTSRAGRPADANRRTRTIDKKRSSRFRILYRRRGDATRRLRRQKVVQFLSGLLVISYKSCESLSQLSVRSNLIVHHGLAEHCLRAFSFRFVPFRNNCGWAETFVERLPRKAVRYSSRSSGVCGSFRFPVVIPGGEVKIDDYMFDCRSSSLLRKSQSCFCALAEERKRTAGDDVQHEARRGFGGKRDADEHLTATSTGTARRG